MKSKSDEMRIIISSIFEYYAYGAMSVIFGVAIFLSHIFVVTILLIPFHFIIGNDSPQSSVGLIDHILDWFVDSKMCWAFLAVCIGIGGQAVERQRRMVKR